MNLDYRRSYGLNRIANGNRRMRVGAGIDKNAIGLEAHFLNIVDDFALNIALKKGNFKLRKLHAQLLEVFVKGHIAVNFCFAFAQKI